MIHRLRHLLIAAMVVATALPVPAMVEAARLKLPPEAPAPVANPVQLEQARKATRRGVAAARKVARWARRSATQLERIAAGQAKSAGRKAGKSATRKAKAKIATEKPAESAIAGALPEKNAPKPGAKPDRQASTAPLVARNAPIPMPAEEVACRDRLRAAGVKFTEEEPLSEPLGCSVPFPIRIENLGRDLELEPAAVLNCRMAEAASSFTSDVIAPLAQAEFETRLKRIRHASAYICRARNGSEKLSEHAFGNALDISTFILEDGAEIPVEASTRLEESVFLSRIRTQACGPFKTVLGPGSDADHATHFHLDLAQRRRGGTFCQ